MEDAINNVRGARAYKLNTGPAVFNNRRITRASDQPVLNDISISAGLDYSKYTAVATLP